MTCDVVGCILWHHIRHHRQIFYVFAKFCLMKWEHLATFYISYWYTMSYVMYCVSDLRCRRHICHHWNLSIYLEMIWPVSRCIWCRSECHAMSQAVTYGIACDIIFLYLRYRRFMWNSSDNWMIRLSKHSPESYLRYQMPWPVMS